MPHVNLQPIDLITMATGAFAGLMSGLGMAILLALDRNIYHWTPLAGMHFLYVAPIIFLVSTVIVVLVSSVTTPPSTDKIANCVWKFSAFAEELAEIAGLPWFKNFRVLSALLLIGAAIFVLIWR